jgi:hypothetical protein
VGVIYGTLMFCTDGDSVGDNEPPRPHRAPAGRRVLHNGQADAVDGPHVTTPQASSTAPVKRNVQ